MEYKVEVIMTPHHRDNPDNPYFWCISTANANHGSGWAAMPEDAWRDAYAYYREHYATDGRTSAPAVQKLQLAEPAKCDKWQMILFTYYSSSHTAEDIDDFLFLRSDKQEWLTPDLAFAQLSGYTELVSKDYCTWAQEGTGIYRGVPEPENWALLCEMKGFHFTKAEFTQFMDDMLRAAQVAFIQVKLPGILQPVMVCGECDRYAVFFESPDKLVKYTEYYHRLAETEHFPLIEYSTQWAEGYSFDTLQQRLR